MLSNKINTGIFYLLITFLICGGCKEEQITPTLNLLDFVTGIRAIDLKNEGNAGDIVLLFSIQNPAEADQVQLFIRKGPDLSGFDRNDVDIVSPDRFFTLDLSSTRYDVSLPSSFTDIEGDPITNGTEYTIGLLISKGGEIFLNKESQSITLKNEHFLNGEFTGTWDDNLYTAFGISARISVLSTGGRAGGDFFYSGNFTSCCMGENDGTISFILNEDGSIEDFIYRQHLVSFQGGECPGTYTGEGQLEEYTTLVINFSGNDCEGDHTGGRIRLSKKL